MAIPKRIFFYWDRGIHEAPNLVVRCLESWRNNNPHWELIVLDDSNLDNWLTEESWLSGLDMPIQKRSNLIRLELLNRYGGVWSDATVFCLRPLDDWLPELGPLGFTCSKLEPQFDRFISSYFLAAVPGSKFIELWLRSYRDFLSAGPQPIEQRKYDSWRHYRKIFFRTKTLRRLSNLVWTLRWVARRWGYPYFILHYLANRIIFFSPKIRREILRMPRIEVIDLLQRPFRRESDSPDRLRKHISSADQSLIKFSHKVKSHTRLVELVQPTS